MLEPPHRLRGAIVRGNLAITKRLLARFPELWLNIDPNNNGWCNLHYASFHGNYLVCFHLVSLMNRNHSQKSLLNDIDLITFDNLTVLHMPLKNHHSQTLHFLLQEFSSHEWINRAGGELLRTPLHYCCAYRFADGLKLLLEFGADWTLQDLNGDTCLHLCFAYNHFDGLQEIVKFAASRRLRQVLRELVGSDEKLDSQDLRLADQLNAKLSKTQIREAVQDELVKLESITNSRGWRAEDYAATFEMAEKYKKIKEIWVDRAVDEELALQQPLDTDLALSMYVYDPLHDRLTKMSLNLLSLSYNMDPTSNSLLNSSLTNNDAGVLSSPMQLIIQPFSAGSRHNSFHDDDVSPSIDLQMVKGQNSDAKVRKHSRSLPLAQQGTEKLPQTRKRSNTSFAAPRPPPIPLSRTPTLQPGALTPQPQTPTAELQKVDITKVPLLKSVTISPSVRLNKRSPSPETEPKKPTNLYLNTGSFGTTNMAASSLGTSGYTGGASTLSSVVLNPISSVSVPNSAMATPTSRTQFSMSPMRLAQRRRSVSTSNYTRNEIAPAARAAAEAAVRAKGKTHNSPALKRNASTPVINSHFHSADNGSRRVSRRLSVAEVPKLPVLELPTADSTLDTIDISAMLIEEPEVRHQFTVPIMEDAASSGLTVEDLQLNLDRPLESAKVNLPETAETTPRPSFAPESSPLTPPTLRRPLLSQSTPLAGSSELGNSVKLVKNVSSISFTRVRDEKEKD